MDNNLWLQKQGKVFFCDYSPNYRLNAEKEESFSHEIFFHGYRPRAGDTCVDIGAGLGLDTRLMSGLIGNEGKVFSIEATDRTFKALEVCINKNKFENKEDEINYLQSTKLTNEYVDVIDVVTTIEFILNNKSLIGEDIIIDGGHTYLLNN